jgi:polysaccharide export outer membrane protein
MAAAMLAAAGIVFATSLASAAQQVSLPLPAPPPPSSSDATVRAAYVLGSDDVLQIRVADAPDIGAQPARIDPAGDIRLPMVGTIRAAGMTIERLESELKTRLREFLREPDVSVAVTEFHSQPVSIVGSIARSGVHQLQGPRTLIEILSLAGGPGPDAGSIVRIVRRSEWGRIPLPEATVDPAGAFSTVDIDLTALLSASAPAKNILVQPHDVITIPRAHQVFVIGEVGRPGPLAIAGDGVYALEAVAASGGVLRTGKPASARILREAPGGARAEIEVDLKKIMDGKIQDIAMKSGDILVIPNNTGRAAFLRALEMGAQFGLSAATWGIVR